MLNGYTPSYSIPYCYGKVILIMLTYKESYNF